MRFLNPTMESEFKKALETLALSHDTQKKAVSIRFAGEGKRRVQVGYVVENPIWKTSYRLVLGTKEEEKPLPAGLGRRREPHRRGLEGRPHGPGLAAGPSPSRWTSTSPSSSTAPPSSPNSSPPSGPSPTPAAWMTAKAGDGDSGRRPTRPTEPPDAAGGEPAERDAAARTAPAAARPTGGERTPRDARSELNEQHGPGPERVVGGDGGEAGGLLPVRDRPAGEPAAAEVGAAADRRQGRARPTRVTHLQRGVQAKFPLLGLRSRTRRGLHLMQGPITVFEGSTYAGDARILDLQPNEERLLTYAIDLGTEVNPVPSHGQRPHHLTSRRSRASCTRRPRSAQIKTYTVKNRNDAGAHSCWSSTPSTRLQARRTTSRRETASDFYRFEVKVPAGKTKTLTVTEETRGPQRLRVAISTRRRPDPLASSASRSPATKVKDGLKQAHGAAVGDGRRRSARSRELQRQLKVITEDQARLRANLKEMPTTAQAYKRYLKKFDEQETQIEKYQADIKKLQADEHDQKKAFDDFLANFSAE